MHFTGLMFITDNHPVVTEIRLETTNISDSEDVELNSELGGERIEMQPLVDQGIPTIRKSLKRVTTV